MVPYIDLKQTILILEPLESILTALDLRFSICDLSLGKVHIPPLNYYSIINVPLKLPIVSMFSINY
jgi:hypothetical protein